MKDDAIKKEIPAGVIIGAIVGVLAAIGLILFFLTVKSDPTLQAPHTVPKLDAGMKNTDSHSSRASKSPSERGPVRRPNDPIPGTAVVTTPP